MTHHVTVHLPPPVAFTVLSLPPRQLSPNGQGKSHKLWRGPHAKRYRAEANYSFMEAGAARLGLSSAVVRATFYWPDRIRRDPDNSMAMLKPVWDGARDALVLIDDNKLYPLPPVFRVDRAHPRLIVEFFDVEIEFLAGALKETP